jgi:hypothetical protein
MMEAIFSSETSVLTRTTWRYIPEDSIVRVIAVITSNLIKCTCSLDELNATAPTDMNNNRRKRCLYKKMHLEICGDKSDTEICYKARFNAHAYFLLYYLISRTKYLEVGLVLKKAPCDIRQTCSWNRNVWRC